MIIINDKKFKTKKSVYEHTRDLFNGLMEEHRSNLLDNILDGNYNTITVKDTHKEFKYIRSLINRHPFAAEKIGSGVSYFTLNKGDINRNGVHLHIYRTDGSDIDISWVVCCKNKGHTWAHTLTACMREAVKDQITEFREKYWMEHKKYTCALCNTKEKIIYHVDHHVPQFNELKHNFTQLYPDAPTTFSDNKTTYHAIFKSEDKKYEQAWQEYHKKHATFRILCKRCNITCPQKKYYYKNREKIISKVRDSQKKAIENKTHYCDVCERNYSSSNALTRHYKTKKHKFNLTPQS